MQVPFGWVPWTGASVVSGGVLPAGPEADALAVLDVGSDPRLCVFDGNMWHISGCIVVRNNNAQAGKAAAVQDGSAVLATEATSGAVVDGVCIYVGQADHNGQQVEIAALAYAGGWQTGLAAGVCFVDADGVLQSGASAAPVTRAGRFVYAGRILATGRLSLSLGSE